MSETPEYYSDTDTDVPKFTPRHPSRSALRQASMRMQSLLVGRIQFPGVITFANNRGMGALENAFPDEAVGVGDLLNRLLSKGNYRELNLRNFNPLNVPVYPGDNVIVIVPQHKEFGSKGFTFGLVYAGSVQETDLGQVITLDFYSSNMHKDPYVKDIWRVDLELQRKLPRSVLGIAIGWAKKLEIVPVKFTKDAIFLVDFAPEPKDKRES